MGHLTRAVVEDTRADIMLLATKMDTLQSQNAVYFLASAKNTQ
jgi:hypothetical protein